MWMFLHKLTCSPNVRMIQYSLDVYMLSALAEGLDPSAAERVFGSRQATIISLSDTRWGARPHLA